MKMKKQSFFIIALLMFVLIAGLFYTDFLVHKTGPPDLMSAIGEGHGFAGLEGATPVIDPMDIGPALNKGNLQNAPGATEVVPNQIPQDNTFVYDGKGNITQQPNQNQMFGTSTPPSSYQWQPTSIDLSLRNRTNAN